MIVKDKFSLLRDVPNILELSQKEIESLYVYRGNYRAWHSGKMEHSINHPGTKILFPKIWQGANEGKPLFAFILKQDYLSPVSYNRPTDQLVINISYFGTDTIGNTSPDP